jgi:hypothetical protein
VINVTPLEDAEVEKASFYFQRTFVKKRKKANLTNSYCEELIKIKKAKSGNGTYQEPKQASFY